MNKFGIVLGVAAVAVLAGCKNPDYARGGRSARSAVKEIPAEEKAKPAPTVTKTCTCAPGTKHAEACGCAAPDCRCVVSVPAPKPAVVAPAAPAEPQYTIYIVQRGDYLAKISKRYNVTIASIRKLNPSIKKDIVRIGQKIKLPGKIDVGVQSVPAVAPAKKKSGKAFVAYSGATREYVVKSGDSLGAIAYGNGITIRQLKELNALKSDRITVGQKLKIPASKAVAAPARKSAPAAKKTEPVAAAPAKTETAPAAEKTEPAQAPAAAEPAPAADAAAPAVEESAPAAADAESSDVKTDPTAEKTYVVQEGDDMTGVSIRWGVSAAAIRELNNLGDNDQLKPGQIIKLPAEAQQ